MVEPFDRLNLGNLDTHCACAISLVHCNVHGSGRASGLAHLNVILTTHAYVQCSSLLVPHNFALAFSEACSLRSSLFHSTSGYDLDDPPASRCAFSYSRICRLQYLDGMNLSG